MSDKVSKVNYNKGLIYKICCKDVNIKDEYVGSTTNFKVRKNNHKTSCSNPKSEKYNRKIYQYIRDNGGFDNWDMILVEYYNCNSKKELEKRERFWIEELKCSLNSYIPTREKVEYIEINKDRKRITDKQYKENNKEKIRIIQKQYKDKNKEKLDNYKSEWYKQNKQRLLEKQSEIVQCECGCEIKKGHLTRHKKTKKHITLIENK